jgi:hypothetical protein
MRHPLEFQKAYCAELLRVMMRYSSADDIAGITATLEDRVRDLLRAKYRPGLNDASYDLYRRFKLDGGAL